MKRSIIAFLALCAALSPVRAQSGGEALAAFERELAEKTAGVESISCRFTQVRTMSVLADEVRKEGRFTCLRPDRILLAFDDGDFIRMTDTRFSIRTAGRTSEVRIGSHPMFRELKRILGACLTGDLGAVRAGFEVSVEQEPGCYRLMLVPTRRQSGERLQRIGMVFDRRDMSLVQLRLEEPSGDATQYEFRDKKFNLPAAADAFDR